MARRRTEVKKAAQVIDLAEARANGAGERAAKAELTRNVIALLRRRGEAGLHEEIVEMLKQPSAPPSATLIAMVKKRATTLAVGLCTDLSCYLRAAKRSAAAN
jgi:hypothetical protein